MADTEGNLKQAARTHSVFDTDLLQIARIYAEALLNAAEKKGVADEIMTQLSGMTEHVMDIDPRFRGMLTTSFIPRDQKSELIKRVFGTRLDSLLVDFFQVLNQHDRYGLLEPIQQVYRQLRDQRSKRVRVAVTSARPLNEEQKKQVEGMARSHFKLEPVLEEIIDADVIGGVLLQVGDVVYDMTVRHRLDQIREQLITRSKHEIQRRRDRLSPAV